MLQVHLHAGCHLLVSGVIRRVRLLAGRPSPLRRRRCGARISSMTGRHLLVLLAVLLEALEHLLRGLREPCSKILSLNGLRRAHCNFPGFLDFGTSPNGAFLRPFGLQILLALGPLRTFGFGLILWLWDLSDRTSLNVFLVGRLRTTLRPLAPLGLMGLTHVSRNVSPVLLLLGVCLVLVYPRAWSRCPTSSRCPGLS